MKYFAFTLDLEPEYAGQIATSEIFSKTEEIEKLLDILSSLGIKITVFAVGKTLESHSNIIKLFQKYDVEFHLHGYSHNLKNNDFKTEISKGKQAYFDYFGKYPIGYRAACGKISMQAIEELQREEFLFDSSVFPSYYPNPFLYLFWKKNIHYFKKSTILEIPITSITPFRVTLSLSYLKLLGINFYRMLFKMFKLPDFICFNTHLHDFINCENSYKQLPLFWKLIYSRNKYSGVEFCRESMNIISSKGYKICFLSEIFNLYRNAKR